MKQPSVLIIADKEDARSYYSLQPQGALVETMDLNDCTDYIKRMNVNVVLLDCGYRVWTGLSTLRQIKQSCPGTAVVFLTDRGSEDVAITAFTEGAKECIEKPVNLYKLKQVIERLLTVKDAADGSRPYKPQNLLQVIAFIEQNLLSSMELEGLAKKAHLSKFHFCRVFKRHTGMNPMKFVAALRIERAKELLTKNDKTVSVVANEVGFRDLSNFIRQFKKITGVTPTMYRDMARAGEAALN